MKIQASEFKAKCLALIDEVHHTGESVLITKHGRIVAKLVAEGEKNERPWLKLQGTGEFVGDPFSPVLEESEIEALK